MEALRPEVEVRIGGKGYQLRWDNAALFEIQAYRGDMEHAGDYRQLVIMIWCLLVPPHPFKTPRELAVFVDPKDKLAWAAKINEAYRRAAPEDDGDQEGAADPLSPTGPSPAAGSASAPPSTSP